MITLIRGRKKLPDKAGSKNMHITDLGGHSGCKILLCETDDNKTFVRKVSGSKGYNIRLKRQAEKQKQFKLHKPNSIKTPEVLNSGMTENGLFYFDMEYIQGITLAEYMKTIEVGKERSLVEAIVHNAVTISATNEEVDETVFTDKIRSLQNKLAQQNNTVINEAIKMLKHHSWKRFCKTSCHGDLTLENIIVKDGQLYLIDFLDSFYDCWIMDISTLMQDVQTMWSYRWQDEVNINTLLRLIVFRDILMDEVRSIAPEDYIEVYYALLLKFIRIYPYTKDDRTYRFLNDKTSSVMRIIKNEESAR